MSCALGSGLWGVSSAAEPASVQVLNAVENPQVHFIDRIVDDIIAGHQQLVECSQVKVVFRCSSSVTFSLLLRCRGRVPEPECCS